MSRRVVAREDFRSNGMHCNYYKQNGKLWFLYLADGTFFDDVRWCKDDQFIEKHLQNGNYIELREYEKITV
jgi:hypothetical protein